jgi:hypothetical protein
MKKTLRLPVLVLAVIGCNIAATGQKAREGDTTHPGLIVFAERAGRGDSAARLSVGASAPAIPLVVPWDQFTWAGSPRVTMDGAQPNLSTRIRPVPAAVVGGIYFGSLTWLHFYQKRTIWAAGSSFRIVDDFDESLSANYGGHFTGGYFLSSISTDMLITSGFGLSTATIFGSMMGFAYQWYVEVLDGYGKDFGFSPYDAYFQSAGAVYYLCSSYSPFLQNFTPKADYYPASWFGNRKKYLAKTPIDDYSAWTFWMSANVHNLLPDDAKQYWPKWLNLAAGYSARDLGYPDRYRVIVLALDFNLSKILPEGGPMWNWWRQTLGFLKIPGPAVEFQVNRETRFYVLYPFKINF